MKIESRETILESATSAFRDQTPSGGVRSSPDWHDLSPDERQIAFERLVESRLVERIGHSSGLSTTARAVLERLPWLGQL